MIPTRLAAFLALSLLLVTVSLAPMPTASATLRICALPVDFNCWWHDGQQFRHCDLYVAVPGMRPSCSQVNAVLA